MEIERERDGGLRTTTFYVGRDGGYYTLKDGRAIAQITIPDFARHNIDVVQEKIVAFIQELWNGRA